MIYQPPSRSATVKLPIQFIGVCALAFAAGVGATAYFCLSMGQGMRMPGHWTMSMMWMRMGSQSWLTSAMLFLLMWLAMMVAMMMPSALPTFVKTRRQGASLYFMAIGYFAIWLAAGLLIYPVGAGLASLAMQSASFSHSVPLFLGGWLTVAGLVQFTRWKARCLSRCRTSFGCVVSSPQQETGFWIGCKQGMASCLCCASPMTIQLALGIMNPLVMIVVTLFISAEKLLPRVGLTPRIVAIAAMSAGIIVALNGD